MENATSGAQAGVTIAMVTDSVAPMNRPAARAPSGLPSRPMMTGSKPGSRPPAGIQSGPHAMPSSGFQFAPTAPAPMPQPKSNALVFVLIAVLLGAIGVLAYLVLTK